MNQRRKSPNPFYWLLVPVGVLFVITACAYTVMAVTLQAPTLNGPKAPHPLVQFIEAYGFALLMGELAALAVFTVGAIATDDYWEKRMASLASTEEKTSPVTEDVPD